MWSKGAGGGQREALSTDRARCAARRIVHMSTASPARAKGLESLTVKGLPGDRKAHIGWRADIDGRAAASVRQWARG